VSASVSNTPRILVVDDNAPARYAVCRMLRKNGFEVVEAATGEEALALANSASPELVLLDVNLPDIHGYEVARRLKSESATSHTPILQLSASAITAEDRVDGLESGADAYLVEPVDAGELVANIRALLRLRNAEAGLRRTTVLLEELLQRERDARKEAEVANRLKDEFLATLSHELRTPLNAILGWLQMLRQDADEPDRRARALDVIERNARAQQDIINDILEVSQIVRGQLRLEMQAMDLVAAVEKSIESVRPTASAKRQTLALQLAEGPVSISADPARVQQMLWNLLSNATKYTPREGRIEVIVTAGDVEVEVTVRDNGIGISPQTLPFVFDRFRQGDAGPTREYGGLGLGLAIVRHLAEMHGGSVRAVSEGAGQGSAFTLTLPLLMPIAATGRSA
jgi:signal transduction histidine kinase